MKSRGRSPTEDKARTYARERRGFAEYPHAFRGAWRKKKAAVEGSRRARERTELRSAFGTPDEATLDALAVESIARKRIAKWGAGTTLGEWVQDRLERRVERAGWNYFKTNYDSALHRERFVAFLASLTSGRRGRAREHAEWLEEV